MGSAYFRFSPHMAVDVELDEKDDKILVDLMWSTMAYVHQVGILANRPFAFFLYSIANASWKCPISKDK